MLPKQNRLKDKYFNELYQKGKKFRAEYGMFIAQRDTKLLHPQFAFVVSKKIGNAVQRHKMTRLLREIARTKIEKEINIRGMYVAYKYCDEYEKLEKEFEKQFDDAVRNT